MENRVKELATKMRDLQEQKDRAKEQLAGINKQLDEVRIVELPQAMEEAGIERVRLAGIGQVEIRTDVRASVPAATRMEAWGWLKDNGFEALISSTINSSTLKAWAKEMIMEGEEIPEDLFRVMPYTYAVIKK